jgi:hypothetical protein
LRQTGFVTVKDVIERIVLKAGHVLRSWRVTPMLGCGLASITFAMLGVQLGVEVVDVVVGEQLSAGSLRGRLDRAVGVGVKHHLVLYCLPSVVRQRPTV